LSPTVPYTANGLRITFTLLTATTYSATIQILNGGATYGPYTGTLLSPGGGQSITRFRAFNFNAGAGVNNNFFVNNIITPSFFDNASTYSAIANSTQSTTSVGGLEQPKPFAKEQLQPCLPILLLWERVLGRLRRGQTQTPIN
jgi:hypothetical protein